MDLFTETNVKDKVHRKLPGHTEAKTYAGEALENVSSGVYGFMDLWRRIQTSLKQSKNWYIRGIAFQSLIAATGNRLETLELRCQRFSCRKARAVTTGKKGLRWSVRSSSENDQISYNIDALFIGSTTRPFERWRGWGETYRLHSTQPSGGPSSPLWARWQLHTRGPRNGVGVSATGTWRFECRCSLSVYSFLASASPPTVSQLFSISSKVTTSDYVDISLSWHIKTSGRKRVLYNNLNPTTLVD
jgi:hypothetical protein